MYRPQRIMSLPPGVNAEPFAVPIVASDVNSGNAIATSGQVTDIPIPMDKDYDFWCCGLVYSCPTNLDLLGFRLRDAWGRYLSDDYQMSWSAMPAGVNSDRAGGYCVVFEPPIYCPKSSYLLIDVRNFSATNTYTWGNMELRGFKAVTGACAA